MRRPVPLLVALALGAAACSGGSPTTAGPSAIGAPTPSIPPACPPGEATKPTYPREVPADLPKPPAATIQDVDRRTKGLVLTRFTTPTSLRESVLFVVREYPKKGFQLGRGDAEPAEADAPWTRGPVRGLTRMYATAECQTLWLLAVALATDGAPYSFNYSPRPSSSPLPFG